MVVQEKSKERITISFSGSVGNEGLMRIKEFVELLEKSAISRRKRVSQSVINKLADEVNETAWKRFKKAKGLK
jgi:hypothetical protein